MPNSSRSEETTPKIAIIGAGVSGLCAAIKLKKELGITSFTIFEEHNDVGGTWLANTYPGCACDIESHLYSFSFEPNPFWSQHYSPQPEIWQYLKDLTKKYDLYPKIQLNTRVKSLKWDNVCKWRIVIVHSNANSNIEAETELQYDIVINGIGGLRVPNYPEQFKSFKGSLMHSAEWNPEIDLRNKVVAVIGTGASSIQIIPSIAKDVKELYVYQRRAPYVVPKRQFKYPKFLQLLFFYVPFLLWLFRTLIFLQHEIFIGAFKHKSILNKFAGKISNKYMRKCIKDPVLQEKLIPDYKFGCKRVMISNNFYQTFNKSHVTLNTSKIVQVNHNSITTDDGHTQEIDVLILCTGFRVQEYFSPMEVYDKENRNALEHWKANGPQAYYGIVVNGAPNHFILLGPNTGLGHNTAYFMIECHANFTIRLIKEFIRRNAKTVEVKLSAQDECMEAIRKEMKNTIWGNENCGSWYASEKGEVSVLWPESCISYWLKTTYMTDFNKFEFK